MNRQFGIGLSVIGLALGLGACGGAGGVPGMPGGGNGSVNPGACGDIAKVDLGRRVHAFLEASVTLEKAVMGIEHNVKGACVTMGKKLGMDAAALGGDTQTVCNGVAQNLKASLSAGLKGEAKLKIDYQPAVCEVKADVAAKAAAQCEAKASADVQVTCTGTCGGTCSGKCDGTCEGSTGSGGECNGQCKGTCEGSCSGSCSGNAEVQAEATCKASAEVKANAEVSCTEPKLDVSYDASLVADTAKLEAAVAAIKAGGPALLKAHAQVTGPVKAAATAYASTAKNLAAGGASKLNELGSQAICVSGQLAAAAKAAASINASVSVSVEASASVGGSAGVQ